MIQNYRTTNRNTEEECTHVVIVDPPQKSWSLHRSFVKLGQRLSQVTTHWTKLEMKFHTLGNEYAEIGLNGLRGTKDALTSPQCCQVFGERRLKPKPVARSNSTPSKTQRVQPTKNSHGRAFRAVEVEMSEEGMILRNKFATYSDVVRVGPWKNDVSNVEDAHNVSLDSVPQSYRRGQRRHPHMGITGLLYWSQKHQRRLSDGDVDKAIPRLGVSSLPHTTGGQVIPHRNGVTSSPGRLSKSLPKSTHFGSTDSIDDDEDEPDNDVDPVAADADDEEEYEQFKAKHRHLFELPSVSSMPMKKSTRRAAIPTTSRSISVVAPVTPPTSPKKKSNSLPTKRGRRPARADTIVRYEDIAYDVTKGKSSKDNTLKWFITSMRRLVSRQ